MVYHTAIIIIQKLNKIYPIVPINAKPSKKIDILSFPSDIDHQTEPLQNEISIDKPAFEDYQPEPPINHPKEPLQNVTNVFDSLKSAGNLKKSKKSIINERHPKPFKKFAVETNLQELERHLKGLNEDLSHLAPLEQNMIKNIDLDIMFIMDCTGSMAEWIDACKRELVSIIDIIQEQHELIKPRISFVAYRDFKDTKQFEIQGFTSDIDGVKKFIEGLKAHGGYDQCEDVAGGLSYALQQNWEAKAKYAVFIADAPAHGKKYYRHADDEFPDGDPEGRKIEDLIEQFAKNDISLYAIKIQNSTEKMLDLMSNVYKKTCGKTLEIANLGSSTKCFGFFVTYSINATITQTSLKDNIDDLKVRIKKLRKERENTLNASSMGYIEEDTKEEDMIPNGSQILNLTLDSSECNWRKTNFTCMKAKCYTWFICKDKGITINWHKPLIQKSEVLTNVWINTKPFAAGSMRYAFYMKDLNMNQKMVGKIPKVLDQNYVPEIMMKDIESILVCSHIVSEFNDRIVSILPDADMLISFVHCYIYEIINKGIPYKYWWVENLIEGNYEKFNNNAGWEAKSFKQTSLIIQALSHYSWQFTNGYLMIVDLQGGNGVLTDPQIHCLDAKRFGKGNLGYEGIVKFFFTHKCSFYCEKLELVNPKIHDELPKNFGFFNNVLEKPVKNEIINKLCDLCKQAFHISSFDYYYQKEKFSQIYCPYCKRMQKETVREKICIDCSSTFTSSDYWVKMKRCDFPVRCTYCTFEKRKYMRKKLE